MLNKLKFQWWKLSTKAYKLFYRLTHRRQIRADQVILDRINEILEERLAGELSGEKPVRINITHKSTWDCDTWIQDEKTDHNPKLREDFVDLRLRDEPLITIRKENK